jgi:dihydroorotase
MLNHVNAGKLTLERFVELTSYNPSMLFKIKEKGQIAIGFDADFTVVDMNKERVITDDWIVSKCGWTPYNNMAIKGWPIMTIIRDNIVMQNDKISDPLGKPMNFIR